MTFVLIAATVAGHALLCLLAADFLAGLLNWAEDTWLRQGISPLIDRLVVAPNVEHHQRPGGIRQATYWERAGEMLGAHVYRATPARGGY
jgi:hypothetical protein